MAYAGYGENKVDLFAPGARIHTTAPNNEYVNLGGTSLAAPSVTGVAALMLSTHPYLTPARIEQMALIGDFAMDIGGGTVLCRVGDDYYLVRGQTVDTALSYLQYELSVILPDTEAA